MTTADDNIHVSNVIDCTRYSSVYRLYRRITAYVLKFVAMLRNCNHPDELSQNNLSKARRLWIFDCQATLMMDNNFLMWKSQFNLYLDNQQIWRRLQNSGLSSEAKYPIILARRHWFTALIVREAHCIVQHNGVKHRRRNQGGTCPHRFYKLLIEI